MSSHRHTLYQEVAHLRTELRRTKRGARWLTESRDYWRERCREAEWVMRTEGRAEHQRAYVLRLRERGLLTQSTGLRTGGDK